MKSLLAHATHFRCQAFRGPGATLFSGASSNALITLRHDCGLILLTTPTTAPHPLQQI
jgi:hypothetical protein